MAEFAEYAINNVNTMVHIPDTISDAEATLIVTTSTATMYELDVMGGVIAGEAVVVVGPRPIGLMGVGVAKALGAQPVILTAAPATSRLDMGPGSSAPTMSSMSAARMRSRR